MSLSTPAGILSGAGLPQAWPPLLLFGSGNQERYYVSASAISFPVPHAIFARTRVTVNSGNAYQYLMDSDLSRKRIYLGEVDAANDPDDWSTQLSANPTISSTSNPNADGKKRVIVAQCDGTKEELWFCEENGIASLEASSTNAGSAETKTMYVGANDTLDLARFYENRLGDLGIGDRLMTSTEIESFAAGDNPVTVLGANCIHWWQFYSALTTMPDQISGGVDLTRKGTGWV